MAKKTDETVNTDEMIGTKLSIGFKYVERQRRSYNRVIEIIYDCEVIGFRYTPRVLDDEDQYSKLKPILSRDEYLREEFLEWQVLKIPRHEIDGKKYKINDSYINQKDWEDRLSDDLIYMPKYRTYSLK